MNILGFVFGWLLIFACTFSLCVHKTAQVRHADLMERSNLDSSRKISNAYETLCYNRFKGEKEKSRPKSAATHRSSQKTPKIYANGSCAKLNIWPLVQDGRELHPALYSTAGKLLRCLYGNGPLSTCSESRVLDAMLQAAHKLQLVRHEPRIPLEQLALIDPQAKDRSSLQQIYYQMLKGTKDEPSGFPSLLDYISCERQNSKLCLKHASFFMLSVLFGKEAAASIHQVLQTQKSPPSEDEIRELCTSFGPTTFDEGVFEFLQIKGRVHPSLQKKVLTGKTAHVCLKKRLFLSRH